MNANNFIDFKQSMVNFGFPDTDFIIADNRIADAPYTFVIGSFVRAYLENDVESISELTYREVVEMAYDYVTQHIPSQFSEEEDGKLIPGWYDETFDMWREVFVEIVEKERWEEWQSAFEGRSSVISLDDAGSYICMEDEDGESIDLIDYMDSNTFVSIKGTQYPFAQIEDYTVFLDTEYKHNHELFKRLLNEELPVSKEQTDVFKQIHDGVSGRTSITYYKTSPEKYKL